MTFEETLAHALDRRRRRGRVTYGALKRQCNLDDASLEDLKAARIEGQRLAVDEEGRSLVWVGEADATANSPAASLSARQPTPQESPPPRVAPSPPDAERRHLTVLFWALGDSTRLAGRLAPEDLREVIQA
jgi:hypothetical protein